MRLLLGAMVAMAGAACEPHPPPRSSRAVVRPAEPARAGRRDAAPSPSQRPVAADAGPMPSAADAQPTAAPASPPPAAPDRAAATGLDLDVAAIDAAVERALGAGRLPGCVVAIGRRAGTVLEKAYGQRTVLPAPEPMTRDTLFDLASLTKVVATTPSTFRLMELERLRPQERVTATLPGFGKHGKAKTTLAMLLTHTAGLPPANPKRHYEQGYARAFSHIYALRPLSPPGRAFRYSDLSFILLGEIVARKAHLPLDRFADAQIFTPLGMHDTMFSPPPALRPRAAPTEERDDAWIRGVVHDPRAYRLGGVAGHAGLFSTAHDLARFARMLLGRGSLDRVRVLRPESVARMTAPVRAGNAVRTLGWDMRSGYAKSRGSQLSEQAYGHTGFTGTTLWIDPGLDLFVILLSNRVHPEGEGYIHDLAAEIADIAATAARAKPPDPDTPPAEPCPAPGATHAGIDVLREGGFAALDGQRIGLLTNASGRTRDGERSIDVLHRAPNVQLVRIFTPEHGLDADREGVVEGGRDVATGVPLVSLFGPTRRPRPEHLRDVDALVFDVQDVGTRFYTYMSTLRQLMHAAAAHDLQVVVLDRPNPLNGVDVAGPLQDPGHETFVNYHPLPVRHGMTAGELARLVDDERRIHADLTVIPMRGWLPTHGFEATGLTWVPPSPNLRTPMQALLYPAVGLLESTNLSVGRGTDHPFEVLGAPWLDATRLARDLAEVDLPGVRFSPIRFTPTAARYRGTPCQGVRLAITNADTFAPVRTAMVLARQLHALHPDDWRLDEMHRLVVDRRVMAGLRRGLPADVLARKWRKELEAFQARRERYLLYARETCPAYGPQATGSLP